MNEIERLPVVEVSTERLPKVELVLSRLPIIALPSERLPQVEEAVEEAKESVDEEPTDAEIVEQEPSELAHINNTGLPPLRRPQEIPAELRNLWQGSDEAWASVDERCGRIVDHAFTLAQRGATFSARSEFKQALRSIAQALDARFGGNAHAQALARGWQALEEAEDFSAHAQRGPVVDVALLVNMHQTPVLAGLELRDVSPVIAMQHYFAYAQEQLVEASGGAPAASRALYGLGRLHMLSGGQSPTAERLHGPKAMALQQAALLVDSSNYRAANELGVLLARFGQYRSARDVLRHGVAVHPLAETWHNLAVVHQRLGETELAQLADAQRSQMAQSVSAPVAASDSLVQWVPSQQFLQQQPPSTPSPAISHLPTPASPLRNAREPRPFSWW